MAKKVVGFASKTVKKKQDWKYVKFVKSVRSDKTGHWRFNETMVRLNGGETLDAALKRIDKEKNALDIEMPVFDEPVQEEAEPSESQPEATEKTEEQTAG
ncbi:MAG: DUF4295 domain-containing protein [FCB group bacterium]|nr:DUF4295 domain-containing protein [FCB group bacterium]